MAGYPHPYGRMRGAAWPGRKLPFLLAISLVFLGVFYALSRHPIVRAPIAWPHAPIVGHAFVADGDSIRIGTIRIRLEGIDAPEWDQTCVDAGGATWACGRTATRQLRERVRGATLSCLPRATDRYGRMVATCSLPDGTDVNAWLVREGWAIAFGFAGAYASEEAEAKAAKRGIWAGSFIAPREWRRQKSHDTRRH